MSGGQHDAGAPAASPLDRLVLPGGVAEHGQPWLRRVGAVLFWGSAQGGFLVLSPLAAVAYYLVFAAAFVWWFVLRRDRYARRRRANLRLRPLGASARWIPLLAAALVAFVLAGFIVTARFLALPESAPNDPLEAYFRRPYGWIAILVLVGLVVPLLEEFAFRGWLQRTLERRMPAPRAILWTTLLFALLHLQAFGFPLRFVFGFVAGYLAWGTRSVWPGVLLHGIYNASLILFGTLVPRLTEQHILEAARATPSFLGALGVVLASGAVLAWSAQGAVAAVRAERMRRLLPRAVDDPRVDPAGPVADARRDA